MRPLLVLYRAIVDSLYRRARKRQHKHVYFLRGQHAQLQMQAEQQAITAPAADAADYRLVSRRSFLNWLRFSQYRKYLVMDQVHPFFVLADVATFFDSVLHSHVSESLRALPVPPRMLGLLFFLLERLSIKQDYSRSHGISLPVDEFDCSRTLAHMVLFTHDD